MKTPQPTELRNKFVRLAPIDVAEAAAYSAIGSEPSIWTYLASKPLQDASAAKRWLEQMLERNRATGEVSFSVYDMVSGELAGSTTYLDIRQDHGGLEIGYTWYGKAFQRSHVNTATKLLLLGHAFEDLEANRVQLQTDARNTRSQTAIARLGAVREGVLRAHKIYPSGFVRDSVLFSVTRDEWPAVKDRLIDRLKAT